MRSGRSLLWMVTIAAAAMLAACGRAPSTPATTQAPTRITTPQLQFGPVYPAPQIPDPLVASTVSGVPATRTPVVSAEIRGYLVDWVIRRGNGSSIWEMAVLKDGTHHRLPYMRPAAAFGAVPPPRLSPEPPAEAQAREAAVASATAWVVTYRPQFAAMKPVVYNYLVRVHYAGGSTTDVWVDPDVSRGRFFYGVRLAPIDNVVAPGKPGTP